MKAVVYHGPGAIAWEEVAKPTITADTDAIVRVDAVTICGTDLHIWKGDLPEVTDGRILGHEAVGTVESVGSGVKNVASGRSGPGVLHHRVWRLSLLPRRSLRPVPRRRGMDPRPQHRRHPGRVRSCAVRRHLDVSGSLGSDRRRDPDARRHPADGLRGRCVERHGPARRRRRGRWRWSDRALRDHRRSALQPGPCRRDRSRRQSSRGRQAVRRRHHDQQRNGGPCCRDRSRSLAVSVSMWRSKRSVSRRPSSSRRSSSVPEATSRTSVSMASRRRFTLKSSGRRTSRSRPDSSTRTRRRRCSELVTSGQLDATRFVTHHFALDQFMEAYDTFRNAGETGALKVVLTPSK